MLQQKRKIYWKDAKEEWRKWTSKNMEKSVRFLFSQYAPKSMFVFHFLYFHIIIFNFIGKLTASAFSFMAENWELCISIPRILSIYRIFDSIAFAHINGRKSSDSIFFFSFRFSPELRKWKIVFIILSLQSNGKIWKLKSYWQKHESDE